MPTYTQSLGLELITPGTQPGLWGNTTNNSLQLIDQAIAGVTPVYLDGQSGFTYVLTDFNGAVDEARSAVLNVTYQTNPALGANTVQIPLAQKLYVVRNSSGASIVVKTTNNLNTVTVANGEATLVFCDGLNAYPGIATAGAGTLTVQYGGTGATTFSGGGFVKSPGGTGALTAASTVNAGTELSGTANVANGGTGKSSLASGSLLLGNGTGNIAELVGTLASQVPTWNGSQWVAATSTVTAAQLVAAGMQGSTSSSGYQKMPTGIIIQWGSCPSSGSGSPNVFATFPIAFPNAFLTAVITVSAPSGITTYNGNLFNLNVSNCTTTTLVATALYTTGAASGIGGRYIAIGY